MKIDELFIEYDKLTQLKEKYKQYLKRRKKQNTCQSKYDIDDELYQLCVSCVHLSNLEELLSISSKKNDKIASFIFSTALRMKKEISKHGNI